MKFPRPLLLLLTLGLYACTDPSTKLPLYDRVPAFTMTDSEGHPFSASHMKGAVWVVDFIYTNCPAECPRMSSQMRKLAKQMEDVPTVHFLSVSVDPARDQPPVLHAFAQRWGAPSPQWQFITGTPASVHLLAYSTFHVGDVISVIEHSSKFALVDKNLTIRGYYSSFDPESLTRLRQDAANLSRSRS